MDKETIKNANKAIKEVYEKISNENLIEIISREEILIREFDDFFIFEDFFGEYIEANKDKKNFKQKLIEEVVDTIDINYGKITIEELVDVITTEEKPQKKINKNTISKEDLFDVPNNSLFDMEYNKKIFSLETFNTDAMEEEIKKITQKTKNRSIEIKRRK